MKHRQTLAINNRIFKVITASLMVLFVVLWLIWGNITFATTHYEHRDLQLPLAFQGFRIAQISDLHDAQWGENNQRLIAALKKAQPDLIVFTGDLIDSKTADLEQTESFIAEVTNLAPVYYVTGNHETWSKISADLQVVLMANGVMILDDASQRIDRHGQLIHILGLSDPDLQFREGYRQPDSSSNAVKLAQLVLQTDGYRILLAHRPEDFATYQQAGLNLVFTGHAHGGQVRLPWIGGLFAPGQGWFPSYDAGVFEESGTTMIVSRGLGNSVIPVRINNQPELVILTLKNPAEF